MKKLIFFNIDKLHDFFEDLCQIFSILFCAMIFFENSIDCTLTRVIQTKYGKLQGIVKHPDSNKYVKPSEVYLGIPYATPPVGTNRFSPTRAPAPWSGIQIFNSLSPVCPQRLLDISNETAALEKMPKGRLEYLKRLYPLLRNQSEDCLYLNIYAPVQDSKSSETVYPVLVYIHGESYDWNSGNVYDGRILSSSAAIIVVTLNYRLGLLGFLNTNAASRYQKPRVANYGLMDQIAALHWIQQNIGFFGGDTSNVTLMGHGSGAASINFLMLSPAVMPGLFHRAILLSGSALSSWALVENPIIYCLEVARQMNCTIPDSTLQNYEHIIDCLREVPLESLMKISITAPAFLSAFGPSVDGVVIKTNYQEEMLTKHFSELLSSLSSNGGKDRHSKQFLYNNNRYDLLFGVVTSEALCNLNAADILSGFEMPRRDKIFRTYVRNLYSYRMLEIFLSIANEYTDWERTTLHPINIRDSTLSALSDSQFVAPLVQMGDLLSNLGNSQSSRNTKHFFYVFDYQTKDGGYPQRMGTVHGEELPYVFGAPLGEHLMHFSKNFTKFEASLSEAVMFYIGNFAKTGNPNDMQKQEVSQANNKDRNRFKTVLWEEYDSVHQKYLEIGVKPRVKNHFRSHQLSLWLRLIPELHKTGIEDAAGNHNLFFNHNDIDLYDGVVRPDPLNRNNLFQDVKKNVTPENGSVAEVIHGITTIEPLLTTCIVPPVSTNTSGIFVYENESVRHSTSNSIKNNPNANDKNGEPYPMTFGVVIAIGCTLLAVNIIIFLVVFYQKNKMRRELSKLKQHPYTCSNSPYTSKCQKSHHHHHPEGSIMVDVERDNPIILNSTSSTLPHNISPKSCYKFSSSFATLPRHFVASTKSHIIPENVEDMNEKGSQSDEACFVNTPNGSVLMTTLNVPKPPPPPKMSAPLESNTLIHAGSHHCHSNSIPGPHQKAGILKVPTAAINEMRV